MNSKLTSLLALIGIAALALFAMLALRDSAVQRAGSLLVEEAMRFERIEQAPQAWAPGDPIRTYRIPQAEIVHVPFH